MRALLNILICGVLFSILSFCPPRKIQDYIKEFVNDVIKLDNEAILGKYFADIENRCDAHIDNIAVIKVYSEVIEEIRTKINPKKKFVIDEIEDRVYKVSQNDFFFYLRLNDNIDLIESILPISKGEKIIGWL